MNKKERSRIRRETLKQLGLCIQCGKVKAEGSKTCCRPCLDKIAGKMRKIRGTEVSTTNAWWANLSAN